MQTVWETLFLSMLLCVCLYKFFIRFHVTVCLILCSNVPKVVNCMCAEYNYNIAKADISIVGVTVFILCS
jgi:hypothetical protein